MNSPITKAQYQKWFLNESPLKILYMKNTICDSLFIDVAPFSFVLLDFKSSIKIHGIMKNVIKEIDHPCKASD